VVTHERVEGGGPNEEKKLVTRVSGSNILDVVQNGFDGTTARVHLAGTSVEHTGSATDFDEANRLVNRGWDSAPIAPALATDSIVRSRPSGDSQDRLSVDASGKMQWGSGAAAADTNLYRSNPNVLKTDDAFEVVGKLTGFDVIQSQRAAAGDSALSGHVIGDTVTRFIIQADGLHLWGPGSSARDVNLYRGGADTLASDDKFNPASLNLQVKAGAPVDGDIIGGAASGDIVLDTTGAALYARVGTAWKPLGREQKLVRKTADETVSNSTILQDDNDLFFAIGANEIWSVNLVVVLTSSTVADFRGAITAPSGATGQWGRAGSNNYTALDGSAYDFHSGQGATRVMVILDALVVNGVTAGNVRFQWAQDVAEVSDTKVLTNSYLVAYRVA
jgi:hypothetical protein